MIWLAALLLLAWVLKTSADEREHRRQLYAPAGPVRALPGAVVSERLTARVRALLAARDPVRPGFDERRARAALGYSGPRLIEVAPAAVPVVNEARPHAGGRASELDQEFGGTQDTAG